MKHWKRIVSAIVVAMMTLTFASSVITAADPPPPPTTNVTAKTLNPNIVGCPTVITRINSLDELDAVIADGVTTTIMVDYTGLDDASSMLATIANKNLAMFVIYTIEQAEELGTYLNQTANNTNGYTDTHVASTNPTVIKKLREIAGRVRASLIIEDEITIDNYPQVVYSANSCYALNVIVSVENITKAVMEQIQRRMISVWVISGDTTIGNLDTINMGSNGIITDNATKLKNDASIYDTRTLVRRPYYVAHRGLPSAAPENTLPAYELAIAAGADLVECDIYITKDGEIILLHDDYFARTTDIEANWTTKFSEEERAAIGKSANRVTPADLTLEQIKRLNAAAWSDNTFAPGPNRTGWALKGYDFVEIPTLREVLLLLADTDVILDCELKDANVAHVSPAYEVIRQVSEEVGKDMFNQVIFISFQDSELAYMAKNHPEASTGRLTAAGLLGAGNARDILRAVLPIYCNGYNPTSSNLSAANIPQLQARGLSVWAYTIDAVTTARNHIDWGSWGITTNYTNRASTAVMGISATQSSYTTMPGEAAIINILSLDYLGTEHNLPFEFVVIDGADNVVNISGNAITVMPGTSATVMLKATSVAGEFTNSYALYSQPVTVSCACELIVSSDKSVVRPNEYFNVSVAFNEKISSNALTLNFTFDSSKFEFAGYTPANGSTILDTTVSDGLVSFTIMVSDYEAEGLGTFLLLSKDTVVVATSAITACVNFVEKETDGYKSIQFAYGTYNQKTSNVGTDSFVVDLIVLSNLIDAFGMTSDHADWDNYSHFDFNGNSEIDIQDIITLSKMLT